MTFARVCVEAFEDLATLDVGGEVLQLRVTHILETVCDRSLSLPDLLRCAWTTPSPLDLSLSIAFGKDSRSCIRRHTARSRSSA